MEPTETPAAPQPRPRAPLFTAESAAKARARKAELRKAREADKSALRALRQYKPVVPDVSDEATRELLPRILTDEIAWRSELLATVRRCEIALLDSIERSLYDASKQTLPQIAGALCKVVDLSDRLVEKAKRLDLSGAGTDQVSGLFAKAVVLRRELVRRGIMSPDGQWRAPAGEKGDQAPPSVDASAESESAPSAGAEGVS